MRLTDRGDDEVLDDVASCLRQWLADHGYVVADPESVPVEWLLDELHALREANPRDGRTREGRAWADAIAEATGRVFAYRDAARVALLETSNSETP